MQDAKELTRRRVRSHVRCCDRRHRLTKSHYSRQRGGPWADSDYFDEVTEPSRLRVLMQETMHPLYFGRPSPMAFPMMVYGANHALNCLHRTRWRRAAGLGLGDQVAVAGAQHHAIHNFGSTRISVSPARRQQSTSSYYSIHSSASAWIAIKSAPASCHDEHPLHDPVQGQMHLKHLLPEYRFHLLREHHQYWLPLTTIVIHPIYRPLRSVAIAPKKIIAILTSILLDSRFLRDFDF